MDSIEFCVECGGTGYIQGFYSHKCDQCCGTGEILVPDLGGDIEEEDDAS